MLRKKLIFALIVLIVTICAVSTASASDNITQDNISANIEDINVISVEEKDLCNIVEEEEFGGNFGELNNKIQATEARGTLSLNKDYKGSGEIHITSCITINGNGHKIDASSKSRIFYLESGTSVTLNNIVFCNGNELDSDGYGGAIYADGDYLEVNNCKFINNKAKYSGAIDSYCNCYYNNCEFISNYALKSGGAIYSNYGNNEFVNCIFTDNVAEEGAGGAVYLDRSTNVWSMSEGINNARDTSFTNTVFESNTAKKSNGGAIFSAHYLKINNCQFDSNSALNGGGIYTYNGRVDFMTRTIYSGGSPSYSVTTPYYQRYCLDISGKTKFTNNTAEENGGAIRIYANDYASNNDLFGSLTIAKGAEFINNHAETGGALSLSSVESSIKNVAFKNNTASMGGGAINSNELSQMVVDYCTFEDNNATNYGGSIFAQYIANITNSKFSATNNIDFVNFLNYMLIDTNDDSITVYGNLYVNKNKMTGTNPYDIWYEGLNDIDFKTKLVFDDTKIKEGESANVCELLDGDGNRIRVESINVVLTSLENSQKTNLNIAYSNITNGYSLNTTDLKKGTYKMTGSVPVAPRCEANTATLKISYIVLRAENITKYYGGAENYLLNVVENDEPLANAQVNLTIDGGKTTVTTNDLGQAALPNDLGVGLHNIIAQVEDASITSTVNVLTTISAGDISGVYLGTLYYASFLKTDGQPLSNTMVKFTVNDIDYTAMTNENGIASVNLEIDAGSYVIKTTNLINNEEKQANLTIAKSSSLMVISASQNVDTVTLTATLRPSTATGIVIFNVNGGSHIQTIENGQANLTLDGMSAGNYIVNAIYNGDNNLFETSSEQNFVVEKIPTVMTLNHLTNRNYGLEKIEVTLKDINERAIANANINLNINGQNSILITDANGQVTLTLTDIQVGNFAVNASYAGNNNMVETSASENFVVDKIASTLTANPLTKTYGGAEKLAVILNDMNSKAIANANVKININGDESILTTDENGIVQADINLVPKAYTATISFDGDDKYGKTSISVGITVKKANSKITASKKTFKVKQKSKKYKITLKNNKGKAIKKAKVTLKVNGKKYKATTNSKGKATFKITKLTKKGTFKATIKFAGNQYYNKASKSIKIKTK